MNGGEAERQVRKTRDVLRRERDASREALDRERRDRDSVEKALRGERASHGAVDAPHRHEKRRLDVEQGRLEDARAKADRDRDEAEASTDEQLDAERDGTRPSEH